MEFRDYLRMLKRGWPAVILITALFVGAALAYLQFSPKTYEANAVVYVSARGSQSIGELQQGSQFVGDVITSYAEMADSAVVLQPVSDSLRPKLTVAQLSTMLTAKVRPNTNLIDLQVDTNNPRQAQAVANAVAANMAETLPYLETRSRSTGPRPVRFELVEEATLPRGPISPNTQEILALGLIVGLCFGLGLTILAQSMDTRIRRSRDIWRLTDVPLLAAIPQLSHADRRTLVVRDNPAGSVGEAFRTLRTNIRFLETSSRHSILVTGTIVDGKGPDISANLGWTLAEAGYRVVLVDADLRHPQIGGSLGISGSTGLAEVLAGQVEPVAALRSTSHPQLEVMLAGTMPPNPSELLGSQAMRELMSDLERKYDYVILHAPPVLSYSDAAVLAVASERTVLTLGSGKTRANELSAALVALGNVGVKPMGIVMSRVRPAGLGPEEYIRPPERRGWSRSLGTPTRRPNPKSQRREWTELDDETHLEASPADRTAGK